MPSRRRAAAVQAYLPAASQSSSFVGSSWSRTLSQQIHTAGRVAAGAPMRAPVRMCGIIGIFKQEGPVNVELYEGLLMLQHRGQDSAGMVTTDWAKFREFKDNGLVKDVFAKKSVMDKLQGQVGIGHVRYPTAGSASAQEAQPFFVNSPLGIYLIHNGNLTNTDELRDMLNSSSSFFNRHLKTDSDSEVLLNIFADEIHRAHQRFVQSEAQTDPNEHKMDFVLEAGETMMKTLQGAYSCICLVKGVGLVAFRDPHGIRPLSLGRRQSLDGKGTEWAIASEDCAFGPIAFERVRDVQPGEMVIITEDGQLVTRQCVPGQLNPCIFEYIYLSRPDSVLNDVNVYNFQLGLGTRLAGKIKERNWDIDVVVPVPDGSRPAAIQVSAEMGLPYREGLVKNRYVGRTFIMPDQRMREMSVRRKLNAMPAVFEGRNVLLIDDSIVRGTTMAQIVDMVRKAGARKVYLASSAPPVRFPNVYGVDMPNRKEFVAHGLTEEEICNVLRADGLVYQDVEDLLAVGYSMNPNIKTWDAACFDGHYVTGDIDDEYLLELESSGRGKSRTRAGRKTSLVSATV
uniref:Amidophosphoribosyltransferase n=2 Tax=Tetradesmus obliquus TaxID=3088 RepID=A0A383VKF7_TETOB|eukprot:jgi/Sobl393_1/19449/SZX66015.1